MNEPTATTVNPELNEVIVTEVMKKAAVIWVQVATQPPRAAWTLWHEGAAYVLHGTGEQQLPGLLAATECAVIARSSDNQAQVAHWHAKVIHLDPNTTVWNEAAALLLPKRLNLADTPVAIERWRQECHITLLQPITRATS